MKREKKPLKVSEILNDFFRKHRFIYYHIKMESSIRLWQKIDDPIIKMHTKAISARDGILTVKTTSPIVSNELSLKELEILDKINNLIGEKLIKKIVFKSGFIKKNEKKEDFNIDNERKISYKVLKKIDNLVKNIKDEDLRERLKKLFIESYRSKL